MSNAKINSFNDVERARQLGPYDVELFNIRFRAEIPPFNHVERVI